MAVQISEPSGFWDVLGKSVGEPLVQRAQRVAVKREQSKDRERYAKSLEDFGISKKHAVAISNFPPKLQEIAINSILTQMRNIDFAKSRQPKKTIDTTSKEKPMTQRELAEQSLKTAADNSRRGLPSAGPQYSAPIQNLMQSQEFMSPLLNSLSMLMPGRNIRSGSSLFDMGDRRR